MKRRSVMTRRVFTFLPVFALFFIFTSNVFSLELTPAQMAEIKDKIRKEAAIQEPERDIKEVNENMDDFISVYKMYKEDHPEMSEKKLIEESTSNILSKLDFVVDDEEYNRATAVTSHSNEPDGYEYIAIYINENLNPDYDATGDGTAERNVAILKENMDKLPEDIKDYALFYIEDIELNIKMSKLEEESNFRKKKENKNALKAIAYSKQYWKDYKKNYLIWKNTDCVNSISQCLVAGEKEMRNKSKDIESSINHFPLLIMVKLQQLLIH
jgi:hypothetical protein